MNSQDYKKHILESFRLLNSYQIDSLKKYQNSYNDLKTFKKLVNFQIVLVNEGKVLEKYLNENDSLKIINNKSLLSIFEMNNGDYHLSNFIGKDSIAFSHYDLAYENAKKAKNPVLVCESLKRIIFYISKYSRKMDDYSYYLKLYKKNLYDKNEEINYRLQEIQYEIAYKTKVDENFIIENSKFVNGIKLAGKDQIKVANFLIKQALVKGKFYEDFDTAEVIYNNALNILIAYDNIWKIRERIFDIYLSLGLVKGGVKDYNKSIFYFNKAEEIPVTKVKKRDLKSVYKGLAKGYEEENDFKTALAYNKLWFSLNDSINQVKQNIAIEKLGKEKIIAEKDAQKKKTFYTIFGAIGVISFILFVSYSQLKNSRRKRLLALQDKELVLKEQEITSINAMLEGQEKERKRVAEDLHDNLGSVIATLKLHFENLKINREKKKINQDILFDKTETLIDEAYLKVRSIAHAKNAGVIANQGLLIGIQMMAEKISSANAVQIEVIHFGLEKRLENSLEISLFRIIQELVANIIKHAEATKATINVSQYENTINIIIEDNGKGMDVSKIKQEKGMGIHSIKTRIKHLQGTFTIDSTPTKGTSILIDVPIE